MFTAKDAAKRSSDIREKIIDESIAQLEGMIESEVNKGELDFTVDLRVVTTSVAQKVCNLTAVSESLLLDLLDKIRGYGYYVEVNHDINDNLIWESVIVSWAKEYREIQRENSDD